MATTMSPPPQQQQEESLSPQQLLQIASMENAVRETDPQVLRVAAQLSWLASQHHASEYNQLKFGGKGSPATYIPLSIQLPFHVKELRVYQQVNAQRQAWWFSARQTVIDAPSPSVNAPVIQAGFQSNEKTPGELQEALSLAISSPLPPLPTQLHLLARDPIIAPAKTSESHPINMSPMVPFELLVRLPIYLQESTDICQPTYLHLPYELTLDALTTPEYFPSPPVPPPHIPVATAQIPAFNGAPAIPPSVLQADMMADIPTPPPAPHRSPKLSTAPIDPSLIPLPASPEDERKPRAAQMLNGTSSEGVTPAPQGAQTPSYFTQHFSSKLSEEMREAASTMIHVPPTPFHLERPSAPEPRSPRFPYINGLNGGPNDMPINDARCTSNYTPPSIRLGNLLLSSCPGKKVRLNGPVKGRGTIFRNLERDLKRIRDSGVGCIVCCLDDGELQFLGVPWEDYSREANQLGLDILRLPTPEGFAPLDVAILNDHLDILIKQYTLRGVSILVHCRGGVGRAGLIACCWMLKLGLCGWIRKIDRLPSQDTLNIFFNNNIDVSPDAMTDSNDPFSDESSSSVNLPAHSTPYTNGSMDSPQVPSQTINYRYAIERIETVDLVERVIRVVRRRRSVKAIETFEQVHFLVKFVEFLRRMGPNHPSGNV